MQAKLSENIKDSTNKTLALPLIPLHSAKIIQFSRSLIEYLEKWAYITLQEKKTSIEVII